MLVSIKQNKGKKAHKVLIVEDEKLLREAFELIFSKAKYKIATASDGKMALKQLPTFKPDIILLDLLMPRMNGMEFLQKADLKHKWPDCKVVVLSNLSDRLRTRDVAEYNVKKVIIKASLAPNELVQEINKLK